MINISWNTQRQNALLKLAKQKLKVTTYLLDSARYVENGSRKSTIWLDVSCQKKTPKI